jgi:hypothetical protein
MRDLGGPRCLYEPTQGEKTDGQWHPSRSGSTLTCWRGETLKPRRLGDLNGAVAAIKEGVLRTQMHSKLPVTMERLANRMRTSEKRCTCSCYSTRTCRENDYRTERSAWRFET